MLGLCDGVPWEAPCANLWLRPDCFVRVACAPCSISTSWEFVGKLVELHSADKWQVDLGIDYPHDFVVQSCYLHRIRYDLNVPGVIEEYLRGRLLQGFRISRMLGADGAPSER